MASTIRFTPDFIKACESLWRDGFTKGVNGDDDFPDFKSFFANTNTKVKEEPSYEEMEKLSFNPSKCEARVEKHGYAIQCTRNPFEGGCLCKTHQNMLNKLPEGKDIPYGRFNQARPDITLDKGNPISWGPKKTRKKDSSKTDSKPKLKVGEMRDYLSSRIPVEDFKLLKKKELTEMYLKVKEKENSSPTSSDTSSENSPTTARPTSDNSEQSEVQEQPEVQAQSEVQEQSEVQAQSELPEQQETVETNTDVPEQQETVETNADDPENNEDDGKGTGLSLIPETPKTVSDFKALFKDLNIDTEGLKGIRAYKQAYDDYLKEKEAEKTEPLSDEDDDELQEDKNTYDETDFEGVSYLEDEDSGKIYNLKHQHVGKWNSDFDNIIWSSEEFKVAHETSRP